MKKSMVLIFCFFTFIDAKNRIALHVGAREYKKMPMMICGVYSKNKFIEDICATVCDDLAYTQQIAPEKTFSDGIYSKKDIKQFSKQGFPLCAVINYDAKKNGVVWRLYDTRSAVMKVGKRIPLQHVRGCAHAVSDCLVEQLTGFSGSFATRIAYCKSKNRASKRSSKICLVDVDGRFEEDLVKIPYESVAPRWSSALHDPFLLYSEYTPTNIRLMSVDMKGKRRIAIDFDGLNMLPAFSLDGKEVVVCMSHEKGSSQLYRYTYDIKKRKDVYTQLTHNEGNNISPTLLKNGDVVFCSDFQTKAPQIYKLGKQDNKLDRLTQDGFCASPAYCSANNKLAYTKIVGGTLQIMVHDCSTGKEAQLTYDAPIKEEPSWSPCGRYLAFSVRFKKSQRIAVYSTITKKYQYITSASSQCSYPTWSPKYRQFPTLNGQEYRQA